MTDYRIVATLLDDDGQPEDIVLGHRGDLFSATSVFIDAEIEHAAAHVYLQEQALGGYITIRSSRECSR